MAVADSDSAAQAEYSAHVAVDAAVNAAAEESNEAVETILEAAAEAIDEAQEQAEAIARAAMETEIGRRVAALEHEVNFKWQEQLGELSRLLQNLQSEVSDLRAATASTATLLVASEVNSPTEQLSLTPPNSETLQEATAEIQEVLPEALAPVVAENPAPLPPVKRRRFL